MTYPPDPLRRFCRWLLAAGLIAIPSALFAQERGTCVTAAVPGAFTLPDGRLHAAGRLTLCLDRAFTPSVGLHRVALEGGTLVLVRSRRSRAEMDSGHDAVVLFHRRPAGASTRSPTPTCARGSSSASPATSTSGASTC